MKRKMFLVTGLEHREMSCKLINIVINVTVGLLLEISSTTFIRQYRFTSDFFFFFPGKDLMFYFDWVLLSFLTQNLPFIIIRFLHLLAI